MRNKWEVQLLTQVVAVSAVLYGVQAPVRAATVYTLENAELANGWSVTGSIDFDIGSDKIIGGSVNVNEGGGDELFSIYDGGTSKDVTLQSPGEPGFLLIFTGTGEDFASLTGNLGDAEPIDTANSYVADLGGQNYFGSGYVTDVPSVPEPSSIMASVTAVTLGVGLRRMKRKV